MPREACRIVSLGFEVIRATKDDITPYAKTYDRRIHCIMVKAAVAGIRPRDDHDIKITVRAMAALCSTSKQPNLLGIETTHEPFHHLIKSHLLRRKRTSVRANG